MTCASRCKRSSLLQGCWPRRSTGEQARSWSRGSTRRLGAMSGMLNTLLDINQIEAGTVRAEMVDFPINDLLDRLRDEFDLSRAGEGSRVARGPLRPVYSTAIRVCSSR